MPRVLIIIGDDPQTYYALEALSGAPFAEIHLISFASLTPEYSLSPFPIKNYKLNLGGILKVKPNYIRVWFIKRQIRRLVRSIAKNNKVFVVNFLSWPLLKSTSYYTVLQYLHGPAQLDHTYIGSIKRSSLRKTLTLFQSLTDRDTINILRHSISLANSRFTISYVSRFLGNAHYEILYPPCEVQYFRISEDRILDKEDTIITVGRISPEKNYELVISLAEELSKYLFLIIGKLDNPRYYASLLKLIKSKGLRNIKILTNVSKYRLRNLYWISKVYIHTMKGEHFGKTVVEAMAGGCVPVVPLTGGCKEILDGVGYTFSDVFDATDKVDRIMRYWSEDQARSAIERSKLFSVEAYKKKFLSILKKYV